MGKKILGILVCMLLILTTMASVVAAKQERTLYKDCYIEINGELKNGIRIFWKYVFSRPYNDDRAFVLWWILGLDEYQWVEGDVTVKIFDQENGQEIWNNNNQTGQWAIKLFFFNGNYICAGEAPWIVDIQGTVKAAITYTGT
jgi:putative cell wall-binding protein